MAERLGFRVYLDTCDDRLVIFNRGNAKILSWKIKTSWQANNGDASRLSREFFDILKAADEANLVVKLVDETQVVEAAKDEDEAFSRRFSGRSTGRYSYTETHLHVIPHPNFEYRVSLKKEDIGALRELLQSECEVKAGTDGLEISALTRAEGYWSLSGCYIEVVRSPFLQELEEEPAAD